MLFGKGYGRYATDHNKVYRELPINLDETVRKGGIREIGLYDYNLNFMCNYDESRHGSISSLLVQKRNEGMQQNQQQEILCICSELKRQLEKNR